MKKRILAITMIAVLTFAMTACSKTTNDSTDKESDITKEAIKTVGDSVKNISNATSTDVTTETVEETTESNTTEENEYDIGDKTDTGLTIDSREEVKDDSKANYSFGEHLGIKMTVNYSQIANSVYTENPTAETHSDENGNKTDILLYNGVAPDIKNSINISLSSDDEQTEFLENISGVKENDFVDDANRTWSMTYVEQTYPMLIYSYKVNNIWCNVTIVPESDFTYDISEIINSKTIIIE